MLGHILNEQGQKIIRMNRLKIVLHESVAYSHLFSHRPHVHNTGCESPQVCLKLSHLENSSCTRDDIPEGVFILLAYLFYRIWIL